MGPLSRMPRMRYTARRTPAKDRAMPSAHHGLLVIDKPRGLTSRAAVDHAQRFFPRGTRVGHTGTLDPLATGLLVICVGAATRLGEYIQRMEKVYRATIRLGAREAGRRGKTS